MWEKEKDTKISGKKRKRHLIRIKVYLYEVFLFGIIYCPLFYFHTILTPFFHKNISGVSLTRGKEFIKYWSQGFDLEAEKSAYEWWRGKLSIYGFNGEQKNIADSFLKVGDESISAIRFWTTAKRKFPHLSYICRKLEPLGTEFKTVDCYVIGDLLFIEFQIGKEVMKHINYQ